MLPKAIGQGEQSTMRVLLVEDEVLIRIAVAEVLRDHGLEVIEAGTGDEAWSYLQTGAPANLVLTDVRMPGSIDGLELSRRVASAYPATKILITSGHLAPQDTPPFATLLPKPVRLPELAKLVMRELQRSDE